jgi:hypothetical protein
VLSLAEVQVGVSPDTWEEEANALSMGSWGWPAKAALQADNGAQVRFFRGSGTVGRDGADDVGIGGVGGGGLAVGLFDLQGKSRATCLTFPSTAPAPLMAPLAKGHQCLFTVLHNTNFHPQKSHFHCGRPSTASLAHFQHSCLNV